MDTACNFALMSAFNAKHDITWSFSYSLCGPINSTGGFTTFLYDAATPVLTGGGLRSGLSLAPFVSGDVSQPGLSGCAVGVGFDSTGLFATRYDGLTTGLTAASPNLVVARTSNDLVYIDSTTLPFNVVESFEVFRTLRFNLTDLGQVLHVSLKNTTTGIYENIFSVDTEMVYTDDMFMKIGFSFATPVSASSKACLKLRDFHYHGLQ